MSSPQKLRAAGVGLQEVVVYKTGLRPALVQDLVKALDDTREGDARYHWVVLFSAFGCKRDPTMHGRVG